MPECTHIERANALSDPMGRRHMTGARFIIGPEVITFDGARTSVSETKLSLEQEVQLMVESAPRALLAELNVHSTVDMLLQEKKRMLDSMDSI